jgi:heparan-alpha-glucosaminide N-acetyltransferase
MLCTFQVFLGAQAGMTLLIFSGWKSRLIRWLAWSVLTGLIGALLCLASQNDGWIPVNKNLWCGNYSVNCLQGLHGSN